ncbi:MAG: type 1 glutamine amidotransferase [Alphaproteobacteria bacterium]|nr:MAG: type 1 glutamine amidotransferase [Alphaproteobacteria bacterium]
MHIGILQTGHSPEPLIPEHGDYGEMFPRLLAGRGFTFSTWSVVDGVFPDSVHEAEGWLLTGSRHGAYDDLPWIPRLEEFIREAYAQGVPLVGICFGHQIIAQALGGRVEKHPGGWIIGRQEYDFSNGLGRLALNAWHQDQVMELPEGAEVVASHPGCPYAALVYEGERAYTIQPHPEFDARFIEGLIETRGRGNVPQPLLEAAQAELDKPVDQAKFADSIAEFFHRAARREARVATG